MVCHNCIHRANKDKICIYNHRKIITIEDALLFCRGCHNYTPCNGLMKRSWGWNNGKTDLNIVNGKVQCETCGSVRNTNLKRQDLLNKKRLKCERCGFVQFQ